MERLASRELVGHDSSTSFLLRTVEDKQLDLLLPNIAVGLGLRLNIPNWIVQIRNAAAAAATTAVDSFNGTVVVAATAAATAARTRMDRQH